MITRILFLSLLVFSLKGKAQEATKVVDPENREVVWLSNLVSLSADYASGKYVLFINDFPRHLEIALYNSKGKKIKQIDPNVFGCYTIGLPSKRKRTYFLDVIMDNIRYNIKLVAK
jgi:hypothetical protein